MKKILLISCVVLFLLSCKNEIKRTEPLAASDTPYFDPNFKYVHLIPDNLRTPEQNEFLKKLQKVLVENFKVVDDKLVFGLSKEEFVAKGIPEEYFILVQKDVINNNRVFKENNIQNLDSILKESYKDLK